MEAWSPKSFFNRRAYGSENLSHIPQKDFCNSIRAREDMIWDTHPPAPARRMP
jgi:hypothetical protein